VTTFGPLFVPEQLLDAVSDHAWLEAMLEAESALAKAEAAVGLVPADAAAAIADACRPELFDIGALAREGRSVGNPAEPLVRALRERVGGSASDYVHFGATSQDVLDTAAMLVARDALDLILVDLDRIAGLLAELAETHRSTPMAARTLLQQAVPTTFGAKAAGWLVSVLEARGRLVTVRTERLAAELGGAAGTLAPLGTDGVAVLRRFSEELGLAEPVLPWHTNRTRIAELAGALETAAGALAKIGLDLALLSQTEVGEVRERGAGGSSTLPQKRNPANSALARASFELVSGYAAVLSRTLVQEHERAAGAWHAEWEALSSALAYTGAAAAALVEALEGLEVDPVRMRHNLELTGGAILAERIAFLLAGRHGRGTAHELVRDAAARASESGRTFEEEAREDARIDLAEDELDAALDPTTYLGSAERFVDRALEEHRRARGEAT
jgi:3-carboxy-cis,cis-muconate cycloisomerase